MLNIIKQYYLQMTQYEFKIFETFAYTSTQCYDNARLYTIESISLCHNIERQEITINDCQSLFFISYT